MYVGVHVKSVGRGEGTASLKGTMHALGSGGRSAQTGIHAIINDDQKLHCQQRGAFR
jgi:hypothetical protein